MISLHFDHGLIPVIAQDSTTQEILMLAYANSEAVELTRSTGFAHYYSRSRKKLWKKGEESGHTQRVVRIITDCDEDALIYQIEQKGAACHTGYRSCFYRTLEGEIIAEKVFDPDEVYANKPE
ncbi:MAG: phosphoribosyl-AMP cyclohydrolase [Methanomicrobiaceae archaeon]|nr:phosphoribosyl-AMP cyclohydrolase [Methanomicrobiaceae archaeon]